MNDPNLEAMKDIAETAGRLLYDAAVHLYGKLAESEKKKFAELSTFMVARAMILATDPTKVIKRDFGTDTVLKTVSALRRIDNKRMG